MTIWREDVQKSAYHNDSIEATSVITSQKVVAIGRRSGFSFWGKAGVFELPGCFVFFFLIVVQNCYYILFSGVNKVPPSVRNVSAAELVHKNTFRCHFKDAAVVLSLNAAQLFLVSLLMFQEFIAFPTWYPVRQTDP